MKLLGLIFAALFCATSASAQTAPPPTPAELVEQLNGVVKQLQALFPAPAPVPAPAPAPQVVKVSTVSALNTALLAKAPRIFLMPGIYVVNLKLLSPVYLEGTQDAILAPADPLEPTVTIAANDVFVVGLKWKCGPRECGVVGDLAATDATKQPARVWIEGNTLEANGGHRGLALHGTAITVKSDRLTGFWLAGQDAQGIWVNNGAGPYDILDNYIEASGENILFGGADPSIVGMVPSDIRVRGNTLVKPPSYKTVGASVKNSLEFKNARRALVSENVIDGWWPGQAAPIQITPRNQDGACTWCVIEDITIDHNTVKNAAGGFAINILGTDNEHPSQQTKRITITHNLFQDSTAGIQLVGWVEGGLVIDHNTALAIKTSLFSFDRDDALPRILTDLTYTNNVSRSGTYGVAGNRSDLAMGLQSLLAYVNVKDWSGNIMGGPLTIKWPAGQVVVSNTAFAALLDPVTFKLLSGTAGY